MCPIEHTLRWCVIDYRSDGWVWVSRQKRLRGSRRRYKFVDATPEVEMGGREIG